MTQFVRTLGLVVAVTVAMSVASCKKKTESQGGGTASPTPAADATTTPEPKPEPEGVADAAQPEPEPEGVTDAAQPEPEPEGAGGGAQEGGAGEGAAAGCVAHLTKCLQQGMEGAPPEALAAAEESAKQGCETWKAGDIDGSFARAFEACKDKPCGAAGVDFVGCMGTAIVSAAGITPP